MLLHCSIFESLDLLRKPQSGYHKLSDFDHAVELRTCGFGSIVVVLFCVGDDRLEALVVVSQISGGLLEEVAVWIMFWLLSAVWHGDVDE